MLLVGVVVGVVGWGDGLCLCLQTVELQLLRQRHAVYEAMPSDTRARDSDSGSESEEGVLGEADAEASAGAGAEASAGGGGAGGAPGESSCFGATSSLPTSLKQVEARLHGCRSLLAVCVGTINDALQELRYEAAELEVEEEGLD